MRVESALSVNDAIYQIRIKMICGTRGIHDLVKSNRGFQRRGLERALSCRDSRYRQMQICRGRRRQREIFFITSNIGGGYIGEVGIVSAKKQPGVCPYHQPMLMPDAEPIEKHRQLRRSSETGENCARQRALKCATNPGRKYRSRSSHRPWKSVNHSVRQLTS